MSNSVVVDLVKGHDLAIAGQRLEFCWFPLGDMVSLIAADADGKEAEIGVIGRDGMVNSSGVLGNDRATLRTLAQLDGAAVRVDAQALTAASSKSAPLLKLILAYVEALHIQASFSALAYAQYPVPQRLARWLLMCVDRVGDTHVDLKHEALSIMLGIRRAGVTEALHTLQAAGSIETHRGGLAIVDRAVLLGIARAGYGSPEAAYVRLIPRQFADMAAAE